MFNSPDLHQIARYTRYREEDTINNLSGGRCPDQGGRGTLGVQADTCPVTNHNIVVDCCVAECIFRSDRISSLYIVNNNNNNV